MRLISGLFLGLALCAAAWLFGFGGSEAISRWAASTQREVQNGIAVALRNLRAGEPHALAWVWGLCLAYGFVHAAGPGHGKLVVGGYAASTKVRVRRMVGLAVASSLAQSLAAIALVSVLVTVSGWGRAQLTDFADTALAPLSYGLIVLLGGWIAMRGLRRYWRMLVRQNTVATQSPEVCAACGDAHGPTMEQVDRISGWRDATAIIATIAIRPCTGALLLLILTSALGVYWVGVIGTLLMGFGTAAFTGLVAIAAVGLRESVLARAANSAGAAQLLSVAEVAAGLLIAAVAAQMFVRLL